tara:strand:- start:392 stop:646 length:255 start_codon:yes stop_codon:yes gene_type:complete
MKQNTDVTKIEIIELYTVETIKVIIMNLPMPCIKIERIIKTKTDKNVDEITLSNQFSILKLNMILDVKHMSIKMIRLLSMFSIF